MTDFDCTNEACDSPVECLQRGACAPIPERNETARNERVKRIIDDTRDRLRGEK